MAKVNRFGRLAQCEAESRARLVSAVCGPASIKDCRLKSEQSRLKMTPFKFSKENLPENRALLLDYLQAECEKFNFRRETYYLCQSYVDTYLDRVPTKPTELQKLGLTCLHIAMKIEEVDLVSLRDILRPMQPNTSPIFQATDIEQMEREVVSVLKFKLLPDTLYFWFDYAVKLWDLYVTHETAHLGFQ